MQSRSTAGESSSYARKATGTNPESLRFRRPGRSAIREKMLCSCARRDLMTTRWNMNHRDANAPLAGVDSAPSSARKRQRLAQYYHIVSTAVSTNELMS